MSTTTGTTTMTTGTTTTTTTLMTMVYPDLVVFAAGLADRGWPVLALWAGTKKPVHPAGGEGLNHAPYWLRSGDAVREAWDTYHCQFALMQGIPNVDGLVLVDLDVDGDADGLAVLISDAGPEAWAWAETTTRVERGPKGWAKEAARWHLWGTTRAHDLPAAFHLTDGLEWRGGAPGYTLLPGCKHPDDDSRYKVVQGKGPWTRGIGWNPLPLPGKLLDVIRARAAAQGVAKAPRATSGQPRAVADVAASLSARDRAWCENGVGGELAKLDALPRPWRSGVSYWHNVSYAVACRLVELGNRLEDLEAVRLQYLEHVPPRETRWNPEVEWAGAMKHVKDRCADLPPDDCDGLTVADFVFTSGDEIELTTPRETVAEAEAEGAGERASTWRAVDIADTVAGLVAGTLTAPQMTLGVLSLSEAGAALFYPGRVNGIAGESNAGKTFTALATAAQEIAAGRAVIFIDLEDNAVGVVGRLLLMGADPADVTAWFHYVQPDEKLNAVGRADLTALLDKVTPSLVVIDSTGEALSLEGANPNADDEVARWFQIGPRWLSRHPCGPGVLVLDHVVKSDEGGGLWPIGSQRKRSAINGVQFMQRLVHAFDRTTAGAARLICAKDRYGTYFQGQEVAQLIVTPDAGQVRVDLVALAGGVAGAGAAGFRPTVLMERVSRYLKNHPGSADRTGRQVRENVTGKETTVLVALDLLVSEGYVETSSGQRGATVYTLVKPFPGEGTTQP